MRFDHVSNARSHSSSERNRLDRSHVSSTLTFDRDSSACALPLLLTFEAGFAFVGDLVARFVFVFAMIRFRSNQNNCSKIRSIDICTHVKIGVSRCVYLLLCVSRSFITRSRKSAGDSVSNATTKSWSSSPNE